MRSTMITMAVVFLTACCTLSFGQTANSMYEAGCLKYKNKDYAGAIEEFNKTVEKSSYFFEAYLERARCYYMLKQMDKALADCSTAIGINVNYHQAYLFRGQLYAEQKNTKAALADYAKCLELRPELIDAYRARAALNMSLGKNDDALKDLNRAIDLNFKDAALFYERALLYQKMGEKDEAIEDLGRSVKADASFAKAYYLRGILNNEKGNPEAAWTDFDLAIQKGDTSRDAIRMRADIGYLLEKFEVALNDYSRLIDHFKSKDLTHFYNRGVCLFQLQRYDEALKDFNKVASQDQKNESANIFIAEIYIKQDKASGALAYFNKVLSINPKNTEVREKRAQMYFDQKKFSLAIEDLDQAIRIKENANDYYLRALCKAEMGEKTGACDDLSAAASLGHEEAKSKKEGYCVTIDTFDKNNPHR